MRQRCEEDTDVMTRCSVTARTSIALLLLISTGVLAASGGRQSTPPAAPPPTTVPLDEADGGTLAADLVTLTDLPAFPTSSVDGYAVRGAGPWRIAGRILAGQEPRPLEEAGTGAEIAINSVITSVRMEFPEQRGTQPVGAATTIRCDPGELDLRALDPGL